MKALSGKGFSESKQPTEKVTQSDTRSSGGRPSTRASGEKPKQKNLRTSEAKTSRIDGPEELAEVWRAFFDKKFSPTECERLKREFEELPVSDQSDELTRSEFDVKNSKSSGPDKIPTEVWKNSIIARDELFEILLQI